MKNKIWILFLVLSIACAGAAIWLFIDYQNATSSVDSTMEELRSIKASGKTETVEKETEGNTMQVDEGENDIPDEVELGTSELVSVVNDDGVELTLTLPEMPVAEDELLSEYEDDATLDAEKMDDTSDSSGDIAEITAEPMKEPEATVHVEINENLDMTPLPVATSTPQIEYGLNTVQTSVEPTPTNWVPREKYILKKEDILPEYKELYEKNNDLIGWLTIEGTNIDYPVVQTDDPNYYLKHDFNRRNNMNGMLIVTPEFDVLTPSQNILIHGHNMRSGKMFNSLQRYASESFGKNHPYIQFDTITEHRMYQVVAAFYTRLYKEKEEGFRYNLILNGDVEVTKYFVNGVRKSAAYDLGVPFDRYDEYLLLSTCAYQARDGRFVVVAKRINY